MQHRWSEDLETFLYQLLKFRAAAGVSATHHLAVFFFFLYKERTREGVWPIKVEEQRAVFLCVCSWCSLEFLQFCRNKQSEFLNPWSGRFLWCDLTCRIVVPLWWRRVHCMVCTIYFFVFCIDLSTFNKLGDPSSFLMVIKRQVKRKHLLVIMCLHICT